VGALRRRHLERRPHGPGRRPCRGARCQAIAPAANDVCHVRKGRSGPLGETNGDSMSMPLMIEALVAVLLVFTILYCMRLNRSIVQFKSQERTMKATISELVTATETAHRAIAGLRATVRESDDTLGERLRAAEKFSTEFGTQIVGAEALMKRFAQLAALQPNA